MKNIGTATYDPENDVLYIEFSDKDVERTQALDDLRLVDFDVSGHAVGVEFIAATQGLDLRDVPHSERIEGLLREKGLQFPIFA
jgi:uncharacterized protein YuzE